MKAILYCLFFMSLSITQLFAIHFKFSSEQIKNLQAIRKVARSIPDKWGMTYEDTLSAICLTESACRNGVVGDTNKLERPEIERSVGALQIQDRTARFMAKVYKPLQYIENMHEAELYKKLYHDVQFSAKIAAYYLRWLSNTRKGRYFNIVSGYNGGYINRPYYYKVMKNMMKVKALKKQGILK